MKRIILILVLLLTFTNVKSQCITGTPPTLTCGTPISVADGTLSGLYGTASRNAPACRGSEKFTYSDLYMVTYQPGMVIDVDCELFIGFLEVLSADGCTSHACNIVDASGVNISGESFVQDATSLNGLLRITLGLDGLGLVAGNPYIIKWSSVANCGGSTCTSATVGTSRAYVISCHTQLANACENNVALSGNTTYTITNEYSSDDHSNLNEEGIDCGYSIESNIIYRWCTDALNTLVNVELTNVVIHYGISIQFAILDNVCGGNYNDIQCQSGITTAQTFTITGTSANTCYWIALDGNAGTWFTTDIRLVNAITLPIELIEFIGENHGSYNLLRWVTSSEINNDYFTIEKSSDAIDFVQLSKISGAGTTNQYKTYVTKDYNPDSPITYYRLKQTDFDGKSKSFNLISVKHSLPVDVNLLRIRNILGQEVLDETPGVKFYYYDDGSVIKKYKEIH